MSGAFEVESHVGHENDSLQEFWIWGSRNSEVKYYPKMFFEGDVKQCLESLCKTKVNNNAVLRNPTTSQHSLDGSSRVT